MVVLFTFLLKDEFLDAIYWIRQVIGAILGVIWGILALKGFSGILLSVLCF